MPYTKQTWVNESAGGTPVSAERLQHMEDGIESVASDAAAAQADVDALAGAPVVLRWDGTDFTPTSSKASAAHKTFIGPSDVDPSTVTGVTLNVDDFWELRP